MDKKNTSIVKSLKSDFVLFCVIYLVDLFLVRHSVEKKTIPLQSCYRIDKVQNKIICVLINIILLFVYKYKENRLVAITKIFKHKQKNKG